MAKVMDNVLTNAVKCSPPEPVIKVARTRRDKEVLFSVQNNGPGLSATPTAGGKTPDSVFR